MVPEKPALHAQPEARLVPRLLAGHGFSARSESVKICLAKRGIEIDQLTIYAESKKDNLGSCGVYIYDINISLQLKQNENC